MQIKLHFNVNESPYTAFRMNGKWLLCSTFVQDLLMAWLSSENTISHRRVCEFAFCDSRKWWTRLNNDIIIAYWAQSKRCNYACQLVIRFTSRARSRWMEHRMQSPSIRCIPMVIHRHVQWMMSADSGTNPHLINGLLDRGGAFDYPLITILN